MSEQNTPIKLNKEISTILTTWYEENKRDLPWRRTLLPYHIWISEMMLQQTQMTRGVSYFERWIARFPSIEDVANASIEELYKYWEGLGYYSRVRNIHITAKRIIEEYDGIIPDDVEILEGLQGIGPYTARAIASIAYNKDVPVVDANVIRIITRIFGIKDIISLQSTQSKIYDIVNTLLPLGNARTFNQAMMEFGAILCNAQPPCYECPFSRSCHAYTNNCVNELPAHAPKKEINRYSTIALLLVYDNTVLMRKRPKRGLWANLWEFPEYVFTPTSHALPEQHALFSHNKNSLQEKLSSSYNTLPSSHDIATAFYDEYALPVTVSQTYITTKYSFTVNRVTLHAFHGTCTEEVLDLHSKYHPRQEHTFFTKEQLLEQTLSSGHSTLRNFLITNIL
ncbi:MAG: A/G-specific adenine glycosylase [Desulfovibrionaceae bacterium]|nr:A/G-specific adenine glycosylase [Desulfovibrionaceae bacterium]